MDSPATLSAAARFAFIMNGLGRAVAARIGHFPMTGPMIVYVWTRLNKINQRFQALAALILAGKLPDARVCPRREGVGKSGAAKPVDPGAAASPGPLPAWRLLPMTRFAWLCIVAPNDPGCASAAAYGDALRNLLGDPEMAALLAATPRMAKLLRPLCWALGIAVSAPRRPRRILSETPTLEAEPTADEIVRPIGLVARRKPARRGRSPATCVDDEPWTRFLALA